MRLLDFFHLQSITILRRLLEGSSIIISRLKHFISYFWSDRRVNIQKISYSLRGSSFLLSRIERWLPYSTLSLCHFIVRLVSRLFNRTECHGCFSVFHVYNMVFNMASLASNSWIGVFLGLRSSVWLILQLIFGVVVLRVVKCLPLNLWTLNMMTAISLAYIQRRSTLVVKSALWVIIRRLRSNKRTHISFLFSIKGLCLSQTKLILSLLELYFQLLDSLGLIILIFL
jgi:hypothetical protein